LGLIEETKFFTMVMVVWIWEKEGLVLGRKNIMRKKN